MRRSGMPSRREQRAVGKRELEVPRDQRPRPGRPRRSVTMPTASTTGRSWLSSRAEQRPLAAGRPLGQFLDRVERAVVLDEAHDVPADPADQVDEPGESQSSSGTSQGRSRKLGCPVRATSWKPVVITSILAQRRQRERTPARSRSCTGHTLSLMAFRWAAAGLLALVLMCGCGRAKSVESTADRSIKQDLLNGVDEIRTIHDREMLDANLRRIVASLRRARGSSATVERARGLAIVGFELTRKGVRSQIDFSENDSGNVAAATRDARRADRYLGRGADRIRTAGLALGIQIAKLDGH